MTESSICGDVGLGWFRDSLRCVGCELVVKCEDEDIEEIPRDFDRRDKLRRSIGRSEWHELQFTSPTLQRNFERA